MVLVVVVVVVFVVVVVVAAAAAAAAAAVIVVSEGRGVHLHLLHESIIVVADGGCQECWDNDSFHRSSGLDSSETFIHYKVFSAGIGKNHPSFPCSLG